jgi:hypothetical protein
MNEIQEANAKVAIEYWQKVLSGDPFIILVYEDGAGREISELSPDFSSSDVRYFWPQEIVEHKGGRYPKPVARKDIIEGRGYYAPDLLSEDMHNYVTAKDSSVLFHVVKGHEMLHETKEAAIAHTKVMLGVSDE